MTNGFAKTYSTTALFLAALMLLAAVRTGTAQDTTTIPYDELKRETAAINTDLVLGTNALGNAKQDLYESLCPRADRDLVFAAVNLELARAKIPDLRDRLTRVAPNFFGGIAGRINKLQSDLTTADSAASASERDVDVFAQGFENRCTDHPLWDAFKTFKLNSKGTAGYITNLTHIADAAASGSLSKEDIQAVTGASANPGNSTSPGTSSASLTPAGNNPNNPAVVALASNPTDPDKIAAVVKVLMTDPKSPMSAADAQSAVDDFNRKDVEALKALLAKYPGNQTLRDMLTKLEADNGVSPADIDKIISDAEKSGGMNPSGQTSDSGTPKPGTSIVDSSGHVQKVLDAHTTVSTTEGPTGILTSETKQSGEFKNGGFVISGAPHTIDWQFNIEPTDKGDGFELQEHSAAADDPDKHFTVQSWSVTDPSGKKQGFPGGVQLKYAMSAPGQYQIQANVETALKTDFSISLSLSNNQ
jgi:hypothetical protein